MSQVTVQWGREVIELMVDPGDTVAAFKRMLQERTAVPIERQKIMGLKPGLLKDDALLRDVGLTAGKTVMLIGTAENIPKVEPPAPAEAKVSTLQDPSSAKIVAEASVGLKNISNTCYMNAAVQMLRVAPELCEPAESQTNDALLQALYDLCRSMRGSCGFVDPFVLWSRLIVQFPTFGELNDRGQPMQHDAQEALNALLQRVSESLPEPRKGLVCGRLKQTMTCKDDPEEEAPMVQEVPFLMLPCNINVTIQTLEAGLEAAFNEEVSLPSEKLAREALFTRLSRVSVLPEYLFIHLVRFSWRADIQSKVKILKPVTFPMVLDLYALCTEELKTSMQPQRIRITEQRDKELERRRAAKAKTELNEEIKVDEPVNSEANTATAPAPAAGVSAGNESGYYELCGVISHKGRSADSGHYVFWGKYGTQWLIFDDAHVAQVSEEDVKRLRGVGEAHIAYVLMYRSRDPSTGRAVTPY
ncbi:putative Ubiquitin family Ubiquitin carboxyl terminal hydrolase [Trypanosoma vivax]|nr:putative Ubiquitin family Ubiquitin carboxyl terminal hydrolase [Trypanosoma vivax]